MGILAYLLFNEIITIRFSWSASKVLVSESQSTNMTIWYYNHGWHQESRVSESEHESQKLQELIKHWLQIIGDEMSHKKITLLGTALSAQKSLLIINIDKSPFVKNWSLQQKIQLIESLYKTLSPYEKITHIHLLVHNEPLKDPQLDFSRPWSRTLHEPIQRATSQNKTDLKRILLEPASRVQEQPRLLKDDNERSFTIQLAYSLKNALEQQSSHEVQVLRCDKLSTFERLTIINGYKPDLYIRLGAYEQDDKLHHITLGHMKNNSEEKAQKTSLFLPYHQAHLLSLPVTKTLFSSWYSILHNHKLKPYFITDYVAAPLSPLTGITAPALYLEIGISPYQDKTLIKEFITSSLLTFL